MSKRATQVALNSLTSIRELRDFKKALDLPSLKEIAKLLRPLSTKSNGRAPPSKKLLQEVVAALMLGPANLPSAWSKLTLANAVLVWVQKTLSIKEINTFSDNLYNFKMLKVSLLVFIVAQRHILDIHVPVMTKAGYINHYLLYFVKIVNCKKKF
jgi:hypothetical protein